MNFTRDQIRRFFEHHHPEQKIGDRSKVSVRCRFHDDRTPSCTLFLDGNGGFNCNGCGAKGNIFQFQALVDGTMPSLAAKAVAEITGAKLEPSHTGLGPALACYDYRGDDGLTVFQKRRYEPAGQPKTFRVYRPSGGVWLAGIDGEEVRTKRVLYNQQMVVTANLVAICEGEKDADNVLDLGLYADTPIRVATTCNFDGAWAPGQSPKWLDHYNPYFSGKAVLIFVDNDKSGETWADAVANGVFHYAHQVRVIRLPDLPEKGDVSDWLKTHSVTDLEAVIARTPLWSPPALKMMPRMFREAVDFASQEIEGTKWLVEGAIPIAGNGIICGDPKASKSFHAVDLAISLACGVDWLGLRVPRRVRTALVSREDSPGLTQRRINSLIRGKKQYAMNLHGWMLVNTRQQTAEFKVTHAGQLDQLIVELKEFGVEFCVLDVFRTIHDRPENDNDEMPLVLEKINRIQAECNCAVALVHHLNKGDAVNIFRALRGASAIHGWMEFGIAISVANPQEEDPSAFIRKIQFENKEGAGAPIYTQIASANPHVVRIDLAKAPVSSKTSKIREFRAGL